MKDFDLSALPAEQREIWRKRLDQLPAGVRTTLQRNLEKVPAERVAKILQDSAPMLDRVIGKVQGARQEIERPRDKPRAEPPKIGRSDHYNQTVRPGDRSGLSYAAVIGAAAAIALAVSWLGGGFGG